MGGKKQLNVRLIGLIDLNKGLSPFRRTQSLEYFELLFDLDHPN